VKEDIMSNLESEIFEQPEVITRLIASESGRANKLAEAIKTRKIDYVMIAARGTSDNAARYAQYLFGAMNGLPVALATPSLFSIYRTPPRVGTALVLGISQSGQSPDIVSVLAEARRQGALTAAITNDPESPLALAAEHLLELHAGPEQSVAATKTYTAELAAMALLNAMLSGEAGHLAEISAVPAAIAATLGLSAEIRTIAARYRFMDRCVVLGRGYNYATAFEIALKMKETNYVAAEPYSPADFVHGPLAMLDDSFPVIVVAPKGGVLPELQATMAMIAERGSEQLVISDDEAALASARLGLRLPQPVAEWLSPMVCVVPGQLLALHMVQERGRNPDTPRAIHKVTLTR
jgi:glutamine---fructose-6-phosphate transaminase (isomerizing)